MTSINSDFDRLYRRVSNVVTLLLAVTAAFGAIIAWASGRLSTSSAELSAILSQVNRNQASISTEILSYRHYSRYADYLRYQTLAQSSTIPQDQETYNQLATMNRFFFNGRYLEADQSYNLTRERQEALAQVGTRLQLDPTEALQDLQGRRLKLILYAATLLLLALSLLSFGIFKLVHESPRIILIGSLICGVSLLIASLSLGIMIQSL